jgi:diaminohydroxyphosphoribosylaminopyrimidine deaminase/5-amino-6-(5-phosphoribosylamino)uracil reductase
MVDINPKVSGRGIRQMEKAGCKVKIGVLEGACIELNKRFIKFYEQKRPYIILKWAQTADGFIDIERSPDGPNEPTWISNEMELALVHKWRTEEQAIMVGTNTALVDNPRLTARLWPGNNPLRIVVDRNLRLPDELHLFDRSAETLIITSKEKKGIPDLHYQTIDFTKDFHQQVLDCLYERNIQSLIVEGGRMLLNSFIQRGYWDEARIFVSSKKFNKGVEAPELNGEIINEERLSSTCFKQVINPAQALAIPWK